MTKVYTSWEDLLWGEMPGAARTNPSKAYETILAAVKASGGWSFKDVDPDKYHYVVLSGPYTGTFEMGKKTFLWHRGFKLPFARSFQAEGLYLSYVQRLWDKLGPLPSVFQVKSLLSEDENTASAWAELGQLWKQSGLSTLDFLHSLTTQKEYWVPYTSLALLGDATRVRAKIIPPWLPMREDGTQVAWFVQRRHRENEVVSFSKWAKTVGLEVRVETGSLTRSAVLARRLSPISNLSHLLSSTDDEDKAYLKAFCSKIETAAKRGPKSHRAQSWLMAVSRVAGDESRARLLSAYILSQAAGLTPAQAALAISSVPGRIRVFDELQDDSRFGDGIIPSRMTERVRFAKELFTTWSIPRAQKVLMTRVEGLYPTPVRAATARFAFSDIPSWKQKAAKFAGPRESEDPEDPWTGVLELGNRAQGRLTGAEFRALWTHPSLGSPENVNMILDVLQWLTRERGEPIEPRLYAALAESHRGRLVLQALGERNFKHLLKEHDFVSNLRDALYVHEGLGDPVMSAAYHARSAEFVAPQGVRPLRTETEFKREGAELHHCVGGYYWQVSSFCFAFQATDGTRATLELRRMPRQNVVAQFYGERNSKASPACQLLLREFLEANARRLVPLNVQDTKTFLSALGPAEWPARSADYLIPEGVRGYETSARLNRGRRR